MRQVVAHDVLDDFPPVSMISPVGRTAWSPSTYCFVVPYLNARGPPAHSATLPPIDRLLGAMQDRADRTVLPARPLPADRPSPRWARRRRSGCLVDLEDAIHPLEGDDHAAADGHGAAGVSRACAPRHDRHARLGTPPDDAGHLIDVGGQCNRVRRMTAFQRVGAVLLARSALVWTDAGPTTDSRPAMKAGGRPDTCRLRRLRDPASFRSDGRQVFEDPVGAALELVHRRRVRQPEESGRIECLARRHRHARVVEERCRQVGRGPNAVGERNSVTSGNR